MIKFILGVLFVEIGIPVLESAVELFQLAIEKRKGDYAIDITKKNKEVHEISGTEEKETSSTHAIGFHVSMEDDEEDEDI